MRRLAKMGQCFSEGSLVVSKKNTVGMIFFDWVPGAELWITEDNAGSGKGSSYSFLPLALGLAGGTTFDGGDRLRMGDDHNKLVTMLRCFAEEVVMSRVKVVKDTKDHADRAGERNGGSGCFHEDMAMNVDIVA